MANLDTNSHNMQDVEMWENIHTAIVQQAENLKPGPTCYEVTVLITQPLCHIKI